MAYNHGREDRNGVSGKKRRKSCCVSAALMKRPLSRYAWRTGQTSIPNRRFYRWTNDVAEYLEDMAGRERQAEVGTVAGVTGRD